MIIPDFAFYNSSDHDNIIAILPLGAHEQHGPHLPFETDTIIAQGIADQLKAKCANKENLLFLPAEPLGYSIEHLDFNGTKSLSYDEAIKRWIKIGEKLHDHGIKKLILLNAHGGNSPLMTIVATELRVRFNMLAVATSWTRFGMPDDPDDPNNITKIAQKPLDIHGGFIETSVMLALQPDKVDMSKAEHFSNKQADFAVKYSHLRAYGPHAFGWKMSDINPIGVAGNAAAASAEAGQKLIDHAVKGLYELIEDVEAFDISQLN